MPEIRWFRVAIAALILLIVIATGIYWQAQNDPLNATDIDLIVPGCIVNFLPDGTSEIIKFGDPRCPK